MLLDGGAPFAAQRAAIDEALSRGERVEAIVAATAGLRDSGPLVYALRRAHALGVQSDAHSLAAALGGAGDATLHALLGLFDDEGWGDPYEGAIEQLAATRGVEQIEAYCLLVRWLSRRGRREAAAGGGAIAASARGEAVPDAALMRLDGAALGAFVAAGGEGAAAQVDRLARRVLGALFDRPRTLSQAHAEQLLARRVYDARGHFFFELLQNADDAGAAHVCIGLHEEQVTFGHDGAPLGARDAVGLASVGLSTKAAGSIGTFGVGFKAVYAVTDRPCVYSEPFCFEIADVSLARPIEPRPQGARSPRTLFVLPRRAGAPTREALAALARAIDASTLLTLTRVRRLELTGPTPRVVEVRERPDEGRAELVDDGVTRVAVARAQHAEGPLLVAWGLDGEGLLCAIDERVARVRCFLPTREHPALPFVVHARFDVPVDRERIERDSSRNRALLAALGRLAAEVLRRELAGARAHQQAARALELLPRGGDVAAPFDVLARELCIALHDVPIVPCGSAGLVAAGRALVCFDERVAAALEGATVEGRVVASPLLGRGEAAALQLGAARLTATGVAALGGRVVAGEAALSRGQLVALARAVASLGQPARAEIAPSLPLPRRGGGLARAGSLRHASPLIARAVGAAIELLDEGAAAALGVETLSSLGVRELDAAALLELLEQVEVCVSLHTMGDVGAQLEALASLPRPLWARAARLPLFCCVDGRRRPLEGDGAALVPADRQVVALAPTAPWLDVEALPRQVTAVIGAGVGPREIVATLAGRGPSPLATLRGAPGPSLDYLAARADALSPRELAALAEAPIWDDDEGAARPLSAMRLPPSSPALAALLGAHRGQGVPRPSRGALSRAQALGLADRLAEQGHEVLVHEAAHVDERHRELLLAAIDEAPTRLGRATLATIAAMPLFDDAAGSRRALVDPRGQGCVVADGPISALLSCIGVHVLGARDAERLRSFLAALGFDEVGLAGALEAAGRATFDRASAAAARALLAERAGEIASSPALSAAASALPVFERGDGALVVASEVALSFAPLSCGAPAGVAALVIARRARVDAERASGALSFMAEAELLRRVVVAEAREGAALEQQPPWLSSEAAVIEVIERLVAAGVAWRALPLQLTNDRRLVCTRAHTFDGPPALLGLPFKVAIASPTFAEALRRIDPGATPRLEAFRLIEALAEATPTPRQASDAGPLSTVEARAALYRALLDDEATVCAEERCWGPLGGACFVANRAGMLVAPRDLLDGDDLPPELDGLAASDEVPRALRTMLSRLYRRTARRERRVAEALLDAHEAAAKGGDGATTQRLGEALAALLEGDGGDQGSPLRRSLKLSRRLHVVTTAGVTRARDALLPSAQQRALIERALRSPPPMPAPGEEPSPRLRALALEAGARAVLDANELEAVLSGARVIEGEQVAAAAYVALAALERRALRSELGLDGRAWLPDGRGVARKPAELAWPAWVDDEAAGRPDAVVHPLFAATVPEELARWMRLRREPPPIAAPKATRPTTPPTAGRERPAVEQPKSADDQGLLGRLGRWLRGPADERRGGEDVQHHAQETADGAGAGSDQRAWFEPVRSMGPQLGAARSFGEQRRRPALFGLLHTPRAVPPPHVYAPLSLLGRHDRATQRLSAVDVGELLDGGPGRSGAIVTFRGRLPSGEVAMPVPLYGVVGAVSGASAPTRATSGAHLLSLRDEREVGYEVELQRPPQFHDGPMGELTREAVWLERTVPDDELPDELHERLAALDDQRASPLERALSLRDLVRARYRYDPSYLEDESVGRYLARVAEGRASAHLAALHAGASEGFLGSGVCFDLNLLLLELLRRSGVPALLATGWVLDHGSATAPDHAWAMALLPTSRGLRLMPLDAATTIEGRALRLEAPEAPRPSGGAPPAKGQPAKVPGWALPRAPEKAASASPRAELVRLVRYLEKSTGAKPIDQARLRREVDRLLHDDGARRALLEALRGGKG